MPFLNRVSICPQGDVINLRDLLFRFSGKNRFENVATRRATIGQFQVFVCVHGHRPDEPDARSEPSGNFRYYQTLERIERAGAIGR